jgi:hypothetical protein
LLGYTCFHKMRGIPLLSERSLDPREEHGSMELVEKCVCSLQMQRGHLNFKCLVKQVHLQLNSLIEWQRNCSRSFEMNCSKSVRSDKNRDNYRVETQCYLGHNPQAKPVETPQLSSMCFVSTQIHKKHSFTGPNRLASATTLLNYILKALVRITTMPP